VTDEPGVRSKSPFISVNPEFVTVEAARIASWKRKAGVPGIVDIKPGGGVGPPPIQLPTTVVIAGASTSTWRVLIPT
jgi:hypothetical protein